MELFKLLEVNFMVSFLMFFVCNFMDLVLFIKNKEYF